jgi:hypothetical protein
MNGEPRMFLIGLGALLVLGGVLYKTQCHLAGDRLAARIPPGGRFAVLWSRHGAAWDSWGSERIGRILLMASVQFCWCRADRAGKATMRRPCT